MQPLLCLTKSDLADPETLLVDLPPARACPWVVTQQGRRPGRAARPAARAHQRADRPQRRRASPRWSTRWCRTPTATIGHVNAVTGRGRHTSTSALMLPLPGRRGAGSSTPRASGPSASPTSSRSTLIEAFPDLDEMTEDCPRGCTHGGRRARVRARRGRRSAATPTPSASSRSAGCWPPGRCRSTDIRSRTGTRVPSVAAATTAGRRLEMRKQRAHLPLLQPSKAVTPCSPPSTSGSSPTSTPARPH